MLAPWQKEIINDLFGTFREDGLRRYRKAYIQIPRGNGKSTLIGALCNAALFVDGEPAALICYAALNQRQANDTGFRIVSEQIRANAKLSSKVKIFTHYKSVEYRPKTEGFVGLSVFRTVSRDSKGLHGLNPYISIIDEYHTHPTSEVMDTLATGSLKRRQPMTIIITTAGFNMEGPCHKEYEYAKRVARGEIEDESYYAKIWEADADDDIFEESTWAKANPNYGISVFRDYFEQQITKVKNEPSYESTFRVLHLNQWMQNSSPWLKDEDWMKCDKTIPLQDLAGERAYMAFDVSMTRDMTALTLLIPRDGMVYSYNWYWMPRKKLRDSADYKNAQFADWVKNGNITLVNTPTVDLAPMFDKIMEIAEQYELICVQYDPYNAQIFAAMLEKAGIPTFSHRQGTVSMSLPTKTFEQIVLNGLVGHGGDPVLRWMVGNAQLKADEQMNVKITKNPRESHRKVDGVITNIMALSGLLADRYEFGLKTGKSYMDDMDMVG
jgi:phage terminase large subunit-like protein